MYAISKAAQLKIQGQWTRWLNYIQQNVFWKSLLVMPVNLTSFGLSSTYDTLPSPTNLKRWKLTTEAFCFLCNKDMYTISHILGACKVALSQGRFTFHHANVLRIIISNVRSSIKHLILGSYFKASHKNKICKKRNQSKKQKFFSQWDITSISDCVLLGDLDVTFSFPPHMAFIELRPDKTIFPNKLKRVIPIELTCPCK